MRASLSAFHQALDLISIHRHAPRHQLTVLGRDQCIILNPDTNVPKEFWNIGIRIEDDALVTAKGCELMTRGVPVDGDEIERLMKG